MGRRFSDLCQRHARSLLGSLIGEMRLVQIELSFNAAPHLVVQLAVAEKLVYPLALGDDQQQLDLVVQLRNLPVASASKLELFEPVALLCKQGLYDILRE